MNGRVYDADIGRFLQADPHIQAPNNSQSYNRYAYVLNNPMSYTDPSGYFFSGLKAKLKKYWKPILAIAASVVTYGAATGWAMGWGLATSTTIGAVSTGVGTYAAIAVPTLSITGAITAGAIAGAVGGAVGGALYTGSLKGTLRGALTGAISGAAGGSCSKGAKLAAMSQALNISIEKFTTVKPTAETAKKGTLIKQSPNQTASGDIWNPCSDLCANGSSIVDGSNRHVGSANLGSLTESGILEGSRGMGFASDYISGMNSGAVAHDVFVGTVQRALGIATDDVGMLGTAGQYLTNQATIIPVIGLNYVALGVRSNEYYYNN